MARGWLRHLPPNSRRPHGAIQAVYVGLDGRQHSKTFDARRERRLAERWLTEMKAAVDAGTWRDPLGPQTLLRDWAVQWLEMRSVRPSTRRVQGSIVRCHILPRFGHLRLGQITQPHIQTWVRDLSVSGLQDQTVRQVYHTMAAVMAAAVDADLIHRSPCRKIQLPTSSPRRTPRLLTPGEAARLIAATRPEYRAMVLTMLGTGLRYGEAAGLRRQDVDLLRRQLAVAQQLNADGTGPRVGPPKTRAGHRGVPLPNAVVAVLANHLPTGGDPEDLVFKTPRGRPVYRSAFYRMVWAPAVAEADLVGLTPHDLRRTYGTWLEDGGIPLSALRELLGHAQIVDVTSRYSNNSVWRFPEVRARVLAVLDERLPQIVWQDTGMWTVAG